ncbi:MAG: amidohydrolase [Gemmatimonadetes bacterium]|nr:amidohydrolase [Gemmatimonadota bacterium]
MHPFRPLPPAPRGTLVAVSLSACLLATGTALAPTTAGAQARAELIVVNAAIHTADDAKPRAQAMAVQGGRVTYVGSNEGARALASTATQVIDAKGRTVIPGMVDAHAHLAGLGQALHIVDLTGTTSYQQVVDRVAAKAKTVPRGTWVLGRGWDQNDWPGKKFPTHDLLTRAVPDHPVLLTRVDGHAVFANATAMELAGVTTSTRDPDGGRLERDGKGFPSGVFVDHAMNLVARIVPPPTPAQWREMVLAAIADANKWGLTGVHDAGQGPVIMGVYEQLAREGKYNLRNYVMISDGAALDSLLGVGPRSGLYDGRLWFRSVKLYMDGALGSRGAALLEPYSDDPKNKGLLLSTREHVRDVSVKALKAGFQVNTHAIGDRGNRVTLDAYEQAFVQVPGKDHRFRIEHAQIVSPADIPRFARLHVIPSMQASHQTSDMYWARDRLGEARLAGAYAWRSLLKTGVIVPNGSDFPVEQVNPLISFHSAVTRQDAKNWPAGGWRPEERMTRAEALKAMTLWPAMAAFQEAELGSLTVGKRADFVILDQDIMTVAPEKILDTHVIGTYLGGKAVYEKK